MESKLIDLEEYKSNLPEGYSISHEFINNESRVINYIEYIDRVSYLYEAIDNSYPLRFGRRIGITKADSIKLSRLVKLLNGLERWEMKELFSNSININFDWSD